MVEHLPRNYLALSAVLQVQEGDPSARSCPLLLMSPAARTLLALADVITVA